ncbi:NADH-quinone oxidoreductase subunit J [Nocardioides insulae]|uniref:NADH-quinone oxidoreductase subunit J n=1 Tax=Nocardioides insulae TaxID=394734 RepID=UPI000413FE2E|nr:NADH-quinone oxidoreductase subunit J [Nocardioides insulae]
MTAFWVLAPVLVLAALGLLFVRKAVHAALLLAVVMISLAVLYAVLEAPFLFAVQIVVYTGAILMLFLFVVMLVGVDASDSLVETIPGQRLSAGVVGILLLVLLLLGFGQLGLGAAQSLGAAGGSDNIRAIADLLFSRYVVAFEVTAALLITAAVGAMVLAHKERLEPKRSQADLAAQRVRDFSQRGVHLGNLPAPGTYARHNAVDTPALLPDGGTVPGSVPRVLVARGSVRDVGGFASSPGSGDGGEQGPGPKSPAAELVEAQIEERAWTRPADDADGRAAAPPGVSDPDDGHEDAAVTGDAGEQGEES